MEDGFGGFGLSLAHSKDTVGGDKRGSGHQERVGREKNDFQSSSASVEVFFSRKIDFLCLQDAAEAAVKVDRHRVAR